MTTAAPPASTGTATAPGLAPPPSRTVKTPTGGEVDVMGDAEERRYNESFKEYTTNISFTERSDQEDLERILFMELMNYRWQRWLLSGRDYDGNLVDSREGELRRWINDYNTAITKIKESLKLDRKGREGDKSATFEERWRKLAEHAREMGVHREHQLDRALEIMQGYCGSVRTFDRSDQEERNKLGIPDEKALVQLWRDAMPTFDEIDEYFRTHQQKYWVRQP